MSMSEGGAAVTLPPGVTTSPGRETVQAGPTGAGIQGMLFTLTLPNSAQTSVFVPYAIMNQPAVVSEMFAKRVNDINGVTNIGS